MLAAGFLDRGRAVFFLENVDLGGKIRATMKWLRPRRFSYNTRSGISKSKSKLKSFRSPWLNIAFLALRAAICSVGVGVCLVTIDILNFAGQTLGTVSMKMCWTANYHLGKRTSHQSSQFFAAQGPRATFFVSRMRQSEESGCGRSSASCLQSCTLSALPKLADPPGLICFRLILTSKANVIWHHRCSTVIPFVYSRMRTGCCCATKLFYWILWL